MWRGMHRFLPSMFLMQNARLKQVPVNHRPRAGGRSKYTNWGRLKETIWDLWAVRWMKRRHRNFRVEAQD
jgi:dolichol-phosphate mannosyltransferase